MLAEFYWSLLSISNDHVTPAFTLEQKVILVISKCYGVNYSFEIHILESI